MEGNQSAAPARAAPVVGGVIEDRREASLTKRWRWTLALALMITAFVAVNLWWVTADTAPMSTVDCYEYLYRLLRFVDGIGAEGTSGLWTSIRGLSVGGRPPLYQLLTVPAVLLFGRSEDAALLVNVLFLALLMAATYLTGTLAAGRGTGLLAAFLVASYAPVIHLTHHYLPHFAVPACVALSLFLLLRLVRDRRARDAWLLAGSLAAGLMLHLTFVWIVFVPTVVVSLYVAFFQTDPRLPESWGRIPAWVGGKFRSPVVACGLVPAALVPALCMAVWFVPWDGYAPTVLLSFMAPAETSTVGFPEIEYSFWWYARTATYAISPVLTAVLAVGLVVPLVRRRWPTTVLVLAFFGAFWGVNQHFVRGWWYFAALLPIAAVLTAAWPFYVRPRWLASGLLGLIVAVASLNTWIVLRGIPPWLRRVTAVAAPSTTTRTCSLRQPMVLCANPPRTELWPVCDVLEFVLADRQCQEQSPCRLMVVPVRELTGRLVRYQLVKDWPDSNLQVVHNRGQQYVRRPYNFDLLLGSDFILFPSGPVDTSLIPRSHFATTRAFLSAPPNAFTEAHEEVARFPFPLPRSITVKLLRRTRPVTEGEVVATVATLAGLGLDATSERGSRGEPDR